MARDVSEVAAPDLSERERQIVRGLLEHRRVRSIAESLCLSSHTVRNHLKSIFRKFGVHSQEELLSLLRQSSLRGVEGFKKWEVHPELEVAARALALLQSVLDCLGDSLVIVNRQGRVLGFTPAFEITWQLRPDAVAPGEYAPLVDALTSQLEDGATVRQSMLRLLDQPETHEHVTLRRTDGREIDMSCCPYRMSGLYAGRVILFREKHGNSKS